MNIVGAHTLTQRAYALAKVLEKQDLGLSYWLFQDTKHASVAADLLRTFSDERLVKPLMFADDTVSVRLNDLLSKQAGMWVMSF